MRCSEIVLSARSVLTIRARTRTVFVCRTRCRSAGGSDGLPELLWPGYRSWLLRSSSVRGRSCLRSRRRLPRLSALFFSVTAYILPGSSSMSASLTARPAEKESSGWRGRVVQQPRHHVIVDVGKERSNHVLDLAEPLGAEQHRLVVGDVVRLDAHPSDVEWPQLRPFDLLDLPVRGEQPSTVGADLATLAYHAELQGEPEDLRNELQRLGCLYTPSRLPSNTVEGGETIMSQAIAVADDLVDHIRLRCIQGHRMMSDVLR